jgi:hypothetical protein
MSGNGKVFFCVLGFGTSNPKNWSKSLIGACFHAMNIPSIRTVVQPLHHVELHFGFGGAVKVKLIGAEVQRSGDVCNWQRDDGLCDVYICWCGRCDVLCGQWSGLMSRFARRLRISHLCCRKNFSPSDVVEFARLTFGLTMRGKLIRIDDKSTRTP